MGTPFLWWSDDTDDQQKAVSACNRCPVKDACLKDSLERREPYGIWGGLTARQRSKLFRDLPPMVKYRCVWCGKAIHGGAKKVCGSVCEDKRELARKY